MAFNHTPEPASKSKGLGGHPRQVPPLPGGSAPLWSSWHQEEWLRNPCVWLRLPGCLQGRPPCILKAGGGRRAGSIQCGPGGPRRVRAAPPRNGSPGKVLAFPPWTSGPADLHTGGSGWTGRCLPGSVCRDANPQHSGVCRREAMPPAGWGPHEQDQCPRQREEAPGLDSSPPPPQEDTAGRSPS